MSLDEGQLPVSAIDPSNTQYDVCWVATKQLRCVRTDEDYIEKVNSLFRDQLPLWLSLSHKHFSPLMPVETNDVSLPTFEVPYYGRGNIVDHNKRYSNVNKLDQIAQIAAGISYLHGKGVYHGNLCPTNILIKDDGDLCVSDPALNNLMRRLTYRTHTPVPATWRYKPPEELLDDALIGPKADVYSWASVVYEVISGKRLYHGYHAGRGVTEIINHGHRALDRPLEINPQLWSILQKCWMFNTEDRPTMDQVESELRGL